MKQRSLLYLVVAVVILILGEGQESHARSYAPQSYSETFYVRPPGAQYGTGDGSDWANAFSAPLEHII